jgi:uncharacterized protein
MIDLSKINSIAVVGASNNPAKYGNRIVNNLKDRGFKVYPVNPKEKVIADLPVSASLTEISELPDLIDLVVPAEIGIKVIKEAVALGVKNIWVQPGAESSEIEEYLKGVPGINYVIRDCVMTN